MARNNNKGFTLVELLAVIVVLAIIALIGYTVVGDVISGAQESADKENVREYARSVRIAITSAQMNGETISSTLESSWLSENVEKTGAEVVCNSVTDNNGTITLSGCSVGGSTQKYCYDGTDVTTCSISSIAKIYGTDDETFYNDENHKTKNLFNPTEWSEEELSEYANLSIKYYKEGDYFLINGSTPTTGSGSEGVPISKTKNINLAITSDNAFSLSTYYIEGDVQSSDSSIYAVAYFGSSNVINPESKSNWKSVKLLKENIKLENQSCACNYITPFWFWSKYGVTFNNYKVRIQLEEGTTATSYEPYGYKIPITATLEDDTIQTIIVYIGEEELGSDDYLSYDGTNWYVVRNGVSAKAIRVDGEVPTGKVIYSVEGLSENNIVYNYE